MRSGFGDATREALSMLVATLRLSEHTGATASTYLAPELRKVVAELVADISGRIQRAQNEFDFLVAERVRFASKPDTSFVARLHPSLSVVADRLASAIQLCGQDDYRAYAHRVDSVCKVRWDYDRLNPLGADVVARAYLACLTDCLDTPEKRSVIEPVLLSENARSMFEVLARANDFMDALIVDPAPAEPSIQFGRQSYRRARVGRERASIAQAFAVSANQSSSQPVVKPAVLAPLSISPSAQQQVAQPVEQRREIGNSTLQTAAAAAVIRPNVAAQADIAGRLGDYSALNTIELIEDNALRFAHQAGEQAHSKRARRMYFETVREQLRAEQCPSSQLSIVDLVAAMFDFVIDDRRLPDSVRPLVWRLQQPALLLSLLDPGYLGDHPRSLRTLLENLGEITAQFGPELTRDSDVFRRLETLVRAVEIVAARLADRSRALALEVEKEFERCASSMTQLIERLERDRHSFDQEPGQVNRRDFTRRPARDEERRVSEHIKTQIAQKTAGLVLPASVLSFLDSVWLRYMRTALLREGSNSAVFKNAEQLIDDLLWTLDEQRGVGDRRQLAQRIPALIDQVNTGMREVNAKEQEHQAFFDELFLIHLRKLQRLPEGNATMVAMEHVSDEPRVGQSTSGTPTSDLSELEAPSVPVLQTTMVLTESDSMLAAPTVTMVGPVSEVATRFASNDDNVSVATLPLGGNRLLSVLQDIDLEDLPDKPGLVPNAENPDIDALACGDWLEYRQSNGRCVNLKVAWLSDRRSVALLVRHPDRRAMSKPMSRLRKLFAAGRLRLIRAERAA